jgi:hypothetical protein
MTFNEGGLKGKRIEKLVIYGDGILCEGPEDATVYDDVTEDITKWLEERIGIVMAGERGRAYHSHLEVTSDLALGAKFDHFEKLGREIALMLASYGQKSIPFEVATLGFHADVFQLEPPRPGDFRIERRVGESYEKGMYYSVAPLRTDDHLKALNLLEEAFS